MLNRRRHRVIALRCKGLVEWSVTQREHPRPKQSLRRLRGGRRADDPGGSCDVHMTAPGGGLSPDGLRWVPCRSDGGPFGCSDRSTE